MVRVIKRVLQITFNKKYCIGCPNCESYVELTVEQFENMKLEIGGNINGKVSCLEDNITLIAKAAVKNQAVLCFEYKIKN